MFDLTKPTLSDMIACSAILRRRGAGAQSRQEVAERIVRYFYEHLSVGSDRSCALVRYFEIGTFAELEEPLRERARTLLGDYPESPDMKCLTLLATAGAEPEWNSPLQSVGHQCIPLASEGFLAQFPMISQLIRQFGLEIQSVLSPASSVLLDAEERTFNVFHVPDAVGSPYIPAQQQFVVPYGIRSAIGFGGILPSANLFAIVLFSKVPIPEETALLFRPLALSIKVALIPFATARLPTVGHPGAGP